MGDCTQCAYRQQFEKDISELKDRCLSLEGRMNEAEKNSAGYERDIRSIFDSIEKIEKGIAKITDKMDEKDQKPSNLLWGVGMTVLGAIILKVLLVVGG